MKLKNKYVIGTLVQFYEIEMLDEYVQSCVQMMEGIQNPENVTFHFCFSFQEHLETIDWKAVEASYPNVKTTLSLEDKLTRFNYEITKKINVSISRICCIDTKRSYESFYNIAAYRRDLCDQWCDQVDYVIWGESDSLFPQQTFTLMESLHAMVADETPKFVASFAGRKNWDATWIPITHPLYRNVPYVDTDEWVLGNEASEKSYMTIERMNQINDIPMDQVDIVEMTEPKADGSCLIISSELIRSGVNIPRSLIHCGEDESFLQMAKIIMGSGFRQYNFNNILRVHNRRHPRKRTYVLNEDNARGFCDDRKGKWWKILEESSKYNLGTVRQQKKSIQLLNVMNKIKQIIGE